MDGFRMVWGPWWPRYPGHCGPRSGSSLDGVHCGPRLNLGLCGRFQRLNLGQIDPVNAVKPFLQVRAPVSTRMPSLRNSRTVRLTVVSPSSVCR